MMALSPGIANACFWLLDLVSRRRLTAGLIRTSFSKIGVVDSGAVVDAALGLAWLQIADDGTAALTDRGYAVLSLAEHTDRLRKALLDYIDVERPAWVQDAAFGRRALVSFLGVPMAQLIMEAGLTNGTSDDVVAFWDSLAAIARGQKEDTLLGIGRKGERLTLAFEQERTGQTPRWVSVDSNQDGYDVLSIVNAGSQVPLTIEVKASVAGLKGLIHLTRNEWKRAQHTGSHLFHVWDLSTDPPSIAVLSPDAIAPHIPSDIGSGRWELAAVPLDTFSSCFVPWAPEAGKLRALT